MHFEWKKSEFHWKKRTLCPKRGFKNAYRKYHDRIFPNMSGPTSSFPLFMFSSVYWCLFSPNTSGIKLVLRVPWNCWSFGAKKPAKLRTLTCRRTMRWWTQPRRPTMAMRTLSWYCGALAKLMAQFGFSGISMVEEMTLKVMLNQYDCVTVCFDCFSEEDIFRARGLIGCVCASRVGYRELNATETNLRGINWAWAHLLLWGRPFSLSPGGVVSGDGSIGGNQQIHWIGSLEAEKRVN